MRKTGAVEGYYWCPIGFSKPALDYIETVSEKVLPYESETIAREVHDIFHDEVEIARKKIIEYLENEKLKGDSSLNINYVKTSHTSVNDKDIKYKKLIPNTKRKVQRNWKTWQVVILFGMGLLACSLVCISLTALLGYSGQ